MEILNWNKLIVIPFLLILYGCGQQTMKDEGLETKDLEKKEKDELFDQDVNEEEDFEIPAFLRKQKF